MKSEISTAGGSCLWSLPICPPGIPLERIQASRNKIAGNLPGSIQGAPQIERPLPIDLVTIDRNRPAAPNIVETRRRRGLAKAKTDWGYTQNGVCDGDEWPQAMFLENARPQQGVEFQDDGNGHVKYVLPRDNRGAGPYVANKLDAFAVGAKAYVYPINVDMSQSYPCESRNP